jgi:hypothetical protein
MCVIQNQEDEIMKKSISLLSAALFIASLGVIAGGCSGGQPYANAPDWVTQGSGAFTGDRGKAFYGVGSAPKMVDKSMQRDRANNRARRDILQVFNTYIAYMMKDYARSTTAGDMSKESYEADVLSVQKTISIGDLNGAQIIDSYQDPQDSTIYSLAILDLAAVSDLLASKGELDAKLRDYVRANAAKAFDDLEKEEAKRGN